MFRKIPYKKRVAGVAEDRILLNYTRIENALRACKKTFISLLCIEVQQSFTFLFYLDIIKCLNASTLTNNYCFWVVQWFESAMKTNFWFKVFCEWHHKWSRFLAIWAHVTWPRAQLLDGSILLKFSLEPRLESESFDALIDFLVFLVQQLWSENNKLINYLIMGLMNYFVDFRS